jgi:hypothetical protein
MVTVTAFEQRKNAQGESFNVLILHGGLEIATSKNTGKMYATVRKVSIPCTFDEATAKQMLGIQLQGEIQRVECDSYEYASKQTGEVITLNHSFVYNPNPSNLVEVVVGEPAF